MKDLLFADETYAIRGACIEVYKEKGCGFLEAVYQECLEIEFELCSAPFVSQTKLELEYKGRKLRSTYQPDLICFGKIVVELKAVSTLTDEHRANCTIISRHPASVSDCWSTLATTRRFKSNASFAELTGAFRVFCVFRVFRSLSPSGPLG